MTFAELSLQPAAGRVTAPASVLAVLVGAAYCQAHGAMSGTHAPFGVSLWWSATGLLPLLAAAAATIRRAGWLRANPVAATLILSLGYAGAIAGGEAAYAGALLDAQAWISALFRALPLGAALAVAAVLALRLWPTAPTAQSAPWPEIPTEIALVRSAGNYLSVEVSGREMLIRLPLHEAARRLAPRGFVQAHRTALVNLARVAETRRQGRRLVLVLDDGRTVAVGRAYVQAVRSSLAGRRSSHAI